GDTVCAAVDAVIAALELPLVIPDRRKIWQSDSRLPVIVCAVIRIVWDIEIEHGVGLMVGIELINMERDRRDVEVLGAKPERDVCALWLRAKGCEIKALESIMEQPVPMNICDIIIPIKTSEAVILSRLITRK